MKTSPPSRRSRRVAWFPVAVLVTVGLIFWRTRAPAPLIAPATPVSRVRTAAPPAPVGRFADQQTYGRGDSRCARIEFAGRVLELVPNARGEFRRISVPASTMITARVPFAAEAGGTTLHLQAEDGGTLLGDAANGTMSLDRQATAAIAFRTSAYDGLQRVTLRRGGESRLLQFWVGAEPPVVARQ